MQCMAKRYHTPTHRAATPAVVVAIAQQVRSIGNSRIWALRRVHTFRRVQRVVEVDVRVERQRRDDQVMMQRLKRQCYMRVPNGQQRSLAHAIIAMHPHSTARTEETEIVVHLLKDRETLVYHKEDQRNKRQLQLP